MANETKHPISEETDKYRKEPGRRAAEAEQDSEYLNSEALEDDLVDPKETGEAQDLDVDNEWQAREDSNKH